MAVRLLSHSGRVYLQIVCCDWHWLVHDFEASKYDHRWACRLPHLVVCCILSLNVYFQGWHQFMKGGKRCTLCLALCIIISACTPLSFLNCWYLLIFYIMHFLSICIFKLSPLKTSINNTCLPLQLHLHGSKLLLLECYLISISFLVCIYK